MFQRIPVRDKFHKSAKNQLSKDESGWSCFALRRLSVGIELKRHQTMRFVT